MVALSTRLRYRTHYRRNSFLEDTLDQPLEEGGPPFLGLSGTIKSWSTVLKKKKVRFQNGGRASKARKNFEEEGMVILASSGKYHHAGTSTKEPREFTATGSGKSLSSGD